jgi:hypothetical protein
MQFSYGALSVCHCACDVVCELQKDCKRCRGWHRYYMGRRDDKAYCENAGVEAACLDARNSSHNCKADAAIACASFLAPSYPSQSPLLATGIVYIFTLLRCMRVSVSFKLIAKVLSAEV